MIAVHFPIQMVQQLINITNCRRKVPHIHSLEIREYKFQKKINNHGHTTENRRSGRVQCIMTLFIYFIFFILAIFSFYFGRWYDWNNIEISLQTDKQKEFICDTIQSRFVSIFVVCWIVVKFMQNANARQLSIVHPCITAYSTQHADHNETWL